MYNKGNYPELSGGHHFCRNPAIPENPKPKLTRPWCFVRKNGKYLPEECDISVCQGRLNLPITVLYTLTKYVPFITIWKETNIFTQEVLMVLLPSIAISLVLMLIFITYCLCRRRKPKSKNLGADNVADNSQQDNLLQSAPVCYYILRVLDIRPTTV